MTEHSSAYSKLIGFINANGQEREFGGYYAPALDELLDWERDEAEDLIWQRFTFGGDAGLADLVAQLKKYNGIEALEDKLKDGMVNSEYSLRLVQIVRILYNATLIEDYLDYIFEYYDKKKDRSAIAVLTYMKPCDKLYDFFAGLYLNSDDSVTRSTAIHGLLCAKGYIKDPMDFKERSELNNMARAFLSDDPDLRKKKLERFENGEFDDIPRSYGLYRRLTAEEAIREANKPKEPEKPGEMVTGVIDATEDGVYIVYYGKENLYIPAKPSEELKQKPQVGDSVRLLWKLKGQSVINEIL